MARSPQVAVIMGAYNCEATINRAVQSIVDQSYQHWQLIICDDASTDGTAARLRELAISHPNQISIIANESNRGLAYSLNRCLSLCESPLVARMDGDDISEPDRFKRQVEFLLDNPNIDLVGTAMRRFNDEGLADIISPPKNPDRQTLRKRSPFCHATVMARRHVFDSLNGYTVAARTQRAEDLDLWFRFFHAGFEGANIEFPHYLVREDSAAIRRRTARSRFQSTYLTTIVGYRLLGYPPLAYIRPTAALLKGLAPHSSVKAHRARQKARHQHNVARASSN